MNKCVETKNESTSHVQGHAVAAQLEHRELGKMLVLNRSKTGFGDLKLGYWVYEKHDVKANRRKVEAD
jgi:hypothetical protein